MESIDKQLSIIADRYKISSFLMANEFFSCYAVTDVDKPENILFLKIFNKKHIFFDEFRFNLFKKNVFLVSKETHSFIAPVYDAGYAGNSIYITSEYSSDSTLLFLKNKIEKKTDYIIKFILNIAKGLQQLHKFQLFHGNLDFSNIYVSNEVNGECKLYDYCLYRLFNIQSFAKDGPPFSSLLYCSPELTGFVNRSVDYRSDLYSLGMIFYQLATGIYPFDRKDIETIIYSHTAIIPRSPSLINHSLSDEIDNIILKLIAKEPEERYQTADEVIKDLNQYLTKDNTIQTKNGITVKADTNNVEQYIKIIKSLLYENTYLDEQIIKKISHFSSKLIYSGKSDEALVHLLHLNKQFNDTSFEKLHVDIMIKIGLSYFFQNDNSNALKYYKQAIATASRIGVPVESAHPYVFLGTLYQFRCDLKKAESYLQLALNHCDGDPVSSKEHIYSVLIWNYVMIGEIEKCHNYISLVEEVINTSDNSNILAELYHACAVGMSLTGINLSLALKYAEQSFEHAVKSNNHIIEYTSLFSQGLALFELRKLDEAFIKFSESIEYSTKNNVTVGVTFSKAYLGLIFLMKGEFDQAVKQSESVLKKKKQNNDNFGYLIAYETRAFYYYLIDDYKKAISILDEAYTLSENFSISYFSVKLIIYKSFLLQEANEIEKSIEEYGKYEQLITKKNGIKYVKHFSDKMLLFMQSLKKEKILKRKISNGTLQQKKSFILETLLELADVCRKANDLVSLLAVILEKTIMITGSTTGAIFLYNDIAAEFELAKAIHINKPEYENILLQIVKTFNVKNTTIINKKMLSEIEHVNAKKIKIKSALCSPIYKNDEIEGYFYLDSTVFENAYNDEHCNLIRIVSTYITLGLKTFNNKQNSILDIKSNKYNITKREKEIIQLVLDGDSNKKISETLLISIPTVKNHLYNIFQKCGAKNRVELVNLFNVK